LAFVDADYVLHLVGDLSDLNNIVLGLIHNPAQWGDLPNRFKCATRVIIPAEAITPDNYPALDETNKHSSTEPTVLKMIEAWKRIVNDEPEAQIEILPSVIYSLDDESARKIIQSYFLADRANSRRVKDSSWMNSFFVFAYEVCWSLSPYQKLQQYSRNWTTRC